MTSASQAQKPELEVVPVYFGLLWLWGMFFSRVHLWWNEASYYTYGWAVPLLACLLMDRSDKSTLVVHGKSKLGGLRHFFGLILIYASIRLVAEPDPFWRLPLWLEAMILILLTLSVLAWVYGRGVFRVFLIPFLFLLTVLPWPAVLETKLVQLMMDLVTASTAEALLWVGHPAIVVGHTLNVGQESVLISNTCSGIRSFQGLLAAALFLVAYLQLSFRGSVATIVTAILIAFFFNLCRAFALSLISIEGGDQVYARWHDPVGYISVTLSLLSIIFFARCFRSNAGFSLAHRSLPNIRGLSLRLSFLVLGCCLLPEIATQVWFRFVVKTEPVSHWHIQWPVDTKPLEEPVRDVLLFDYGEIGQMVLSDDNLARVIHFGYDGSSPGASICSRNHDPATCMGHLGTKLFDGVHDVTCEVADARLTFRHYVAGKQDSTGRFSLHVWWCPWVVDMRSGAFTDLGGSLLDKGRRFLSGKLSFERKVLLVLLEGPRNTVEAETGLREVVQKIVRSGRE